jgi:hypothetical protein
MKDISMTEYERSDGICNKGFGDDYVSFLQKQ